MDASYEASPLITGLRIEELFGLYTYKLPQRSAFSNAVILYGDNGVGKSTILRLAFHLLSPEDGKNHRSTLYKTAFKRFEIDLATGITLAAARDDADDPRILNLSIREGEKILAFWPFRPRAEREAQGEYAYDVVVDDQGELRRVPRRLRRAARPPGVAFGESAYLHLLREVTPVAFILNAERRLDSDSVSDPSDEMELRRFIRLDEPRRISDLVVRSRSIALSQALAAAARWIQSKAVQSANQGSTNVHAVYVNVLNHLMAPTSRAKAVAPADIAKLSDRLEQIQKKTENFAKYELTSPLLTDAFVQALGSAKTKRDIAIHLLRPYIESLESRLNTLEPIYTLIDKFVSIINSFLRDKRIGFRLSSGFMIANKLNKALEPANLSSGEQQLLLLFCYVLIARDQPSVFMIDEPEISLNVKWQRQLVQSLLDITAYSKIQFIFASHSVELLSQHRGRVVQLVEES